MKKKVLALVLAVLMTVAVSGVGMADITESSGTKTGTANLSFDVDQKYTVTIPEAVTVTDGGVAMDTVIGNGAVGVLAGTLLDNGETLTVKVSSDNFLTNAYRLKLTGTEEYVAYKLLKGAEETEITIDNSEVLSVAAGNQEAQSVALKYTLNGTITKSGTYTDVLTFTVAVTPAG